MERKPLFLHSPASTESSIIVMLENNINYILELYLIT
jgi:hypothetical protein